MRVALPIVLLLSSVLSAQDDKPSAPTPSPEVQQARARAEVHNKRVLLVLSAEGDDLLTKLKRTRELSRPMLYEFEVVALHGDATDAFRGEADLPALVILEAQHGEVLARIPGGDFLRDGAVDPALLELWRPHFCKPVDAEEKLRAALAEAKATRRYVLVRFDAPW